MKEQLGIWIKYYKFLYSWYYYIMGFFLWLLKKVVKPDKNIILFSSFGGKKFDDSPKVIYDLMLLDNRFNQFKLVWAFHKPDNFEIPRGEKVRTDTWSFFITALRARCWITNSSIERGIKFKGKNTFYLNTWHGTPIKRMGADIATINKSFRRKGKSALDAFLVQGKFEAEIFSRVFRINPNKIYLYGLPRNDSLVNYAKTDKELIAKELGLPAGKRVILYAPTFREYDRDNKKRCIIAPPININKWKKNLSQDYVFLFRAHYEVAKALHIEFDNEFIFDVSRYGILNKLMLVSDLLISDYSSIFFDYSIMEKPMFCFAYDYDRYASERGMYFDIRQKLTSCSNEDSLIDAIKKLDSQKEIKKAINFKKEFIDAYGEATQLSLNLIYNNIE